MYDISTYRQEDNPGLWRERFNEVACLYCKLDFTENLRKQTKVKLAYVCINTVRGCEVALCHAIHQELIMTIYINSKEDPSEIGCVNLVLNFTPNMNKYKYIY